MIKRWFICFLCIALIVIPLNGFATTKSVSAIISEDGLTIIGSADREGVPVSLVLIRAEDDSVNLDNSPEKILRLSQAVSGAEGNFSFNIVLPNTLKGVDLIGRIKIAGEEQEKVTIHILSDEELVNLYDEFMALSTIDGIEKFLNDNKGNLSLNLSLLEELNRPEDVLSQMLASKSEVTSAQKIAKIFTDFCTAQKETEYQEELDKRAIDALNRSTKSTFSRVLENYNDRYGLSLEAEYGFKRVKKAGSNAVNNIWEKVHNLESISELKKEFDDAVATEVINVASRTEMEMAIEKNSACFKKMLEGAFGSLSDSNKADVYRDAEKTEFSDTQEINDWFETKALSFKQASSNKPSGGGGMSGFYAETNIVENSTNQQIPQDDVKKNTFNDLSSVPWAIDAIESFAEKGIVSGNGAGVFEPQRDVKREEFTKMLVLNFDLMIDYAVPTFDDVTRDDWFYPYVASAQKKGIVTGTSKEFFDAGSSITRQDIAVLIYRALKLNNQLPEVEREYVGFADESHIAPYAKDAVIALYQAGIINGFGNGNFGPGETATRAQAVKMLYESQR